MYRKPSSALNRPLRRTRSRGLMLLPPALTFLGATGLAALTSPECLAESQPGVSTSVAPTQPSPWGLTALSNLSTSLHSWNDPNHQASADLWLIPSYKLGSKFRLSTTLVLEREITGEQQTQISRSDLGLGWAGSELNPFLKLTVGSALKLPLVTNARARDSLITAVKVAPRLNLSLERLGLPSLSAFYENSGTLAFHEYETATSGRPNTRISWGQTLSGSWAPGEKFSATSTFAWVNAWTYGGTRTTSYQLDQQVSWQFTPVIGASVGIGNTGSPLKANGTDSAVSLIDPESSQAYCTLSLTL